MTTRLTDPAAVATALATPTLVPPPAPDSLQPGATHDLRASMARFSSASAHAERRAEVAELVEWYDLGAIEVSADVATTERLAGSIDAMADIARRVPTEVLLHAAGVPAFEHAGLLVDVRAMVAVIGRGEPSSAASDHSVERLLARFRHHPAGAVPVVSMLYQAHDATAWLIGTVLLAESQGSPRRHAVVQTARLALADTTIGSALIPSGTIVALDLAAADLEFGAGPHECPGRRVAEAIVAGVQAAVRRAGYAVDHDGVVVDEHGRPSVLPMAPGASAA